MTESERPKRTRAGTKRASPSTPKRARRPAASPNLQPTAEPAAPPVLDPAPPPEAAPEAAPPGAAAPPEGGVQAEAGPPRGGGAQPAPASSRAGGAQPEPAPPPGASSKPPARRRIVVTGATGFIGAAVCRHLHERGDQVIAFIREPGRVGRIRDLAAEGLELVEDDLSDVARLTERLRDAEADALVHAAGSYRVGIAKRERGAMWDANVGTTTRVLDAAEAARIPRIVYLSTCNVFGNTRGEVVDEAYRRDLGQGFLSWYDETKYGAHEVVEQRVRAGAPIVIVLPSQAYGPGDHTALGEQLRLASQGGLRATILPDAGLGYVHVDDLAAGIAAALDRGTTGESYILSGPTARLREAIALAAAIGGHAPPRLRIPTALLRLLAPIGGLIGRPNLHEIIAAGDGVTYWASAAKAERELGWLPRDLETGFRDTFSRA